MDQVVASALELLCLLTGRVLVRVCSLGHLRPEALNGEEGKVYGAAGALWFVRDGERVVTETGQMFVGITFYVLVGGLVVYALAV